MKIKSMFYFLFLISELSYSISPSDLDINMEKRREKQEELRKLENSLEKRKNENYPLYEIIPQNEKKGSRINKIIVEGNTILPEKTLKELENKYIGKYGGKNVVNFLKELENNYLKKGYIATRVKLDIKNSDFKEGIITYKVIEGKVEAIKFKEARKSDKRRIKASFPLENGDIINIRDLDQGIDNLNSVSCNNAKFDLVPGNQLGTTIVEVENQRNKKISGTINYNNLGQETTGNERAKVSLTIEDLLGMNDSFIGVYQRKLGVKRDKRDNENFSFYYKIPYKYWEFAVSKDQSEYVSTVEALNNSYKSNGISKNENYSIRRVLNRNSEGKTDFGITLTKKNTKNYLEDIKLVSSSRRLSILKFDLNNQRKFLDGILYTNLAYHRGIDRFGAEKDDGKEKDTPRAQFSKYTLDLNWYRPFKIKNQNFAYRFGFGGQYTDDILYPSEKLVIGDDTTVRGFKDNSIMGDKGFYLRNELSLNYKIFEPFIAYDIGRVKDVYKDENYRRCGNELSGASIGLRVYYGGFIGSITYSKPISAPKYVEKNKQEVYISISYSF